MDLDTYIEKMVEQGQTRFEALCWIANSDEARDLFVPEFIFQARERLSAEFGV